MESDPAIKWILVMSDKSILHCLSFDSMYDKKMLPCKRKLFLYLFYHFHSIHLISKGQIFWRVLISNSRFMTVANKLLAWKIREDSENWTPWGQFSWVHRKQLNLTAFLLFSLWGLPIPKICKIQLCLIKTWLSQQLCLHKSLGVMGKGVFSDCLS